MITAHTACDASDAATSKSLSSAVARPGRGRFERGGRVASSKAHGCGRLETRMTSAWLVSNCGAGSGRGNDRCGPSRVNRVQTAEEEVEEAERGK